MIMPQLPQTPEQQDTHRLNQPTDGCPLFNISLCPLYVSLLFRNAGKCKHKLTLLMVYGLLMFIFQLGSRREVNRAMTRPQFIENLQQFFPELERLPHADTLYRLLRDIDVEHIEQAHADLIRRLIHGKKFSRFRINNCYPIAIDGSQKFTRDHLWDVNPLQRTHGKEENSHTQYYVYVLEASLSFRNGMVIPLLSEFLEPRTLS
ncbi:MAG: transposase family protein [Sedimenticola sp.]